tara:strand:+ start:427 stop:561 length:135 start_codon:yes stop_codon:yes gene_type:complete
MNIAKRPMKNCSKPPENNIGTDTMSTYTHHINVKTIAITVVLPL